MQFKKKKMVRHKGIYSQRKNILNYFIYSTKLFHWSSTVIKLLPRRVSSCFYWMLSYRFLLSLPSFTKLTQEWDSGINFKSSFSLQGTGRWRNGEQLHFLSHSVPSTYFSSFSFPPTVCPFPPTISICSQ